MVRSRGRQVFGFLLGLVLVTGCTATPPLDDASAEGTTAETTSSPATETTSPATETSGGGTQTQVNKPAVSVPKLPIGGAGQGSEHEQCVSVSYLGDEPIPSGVRVTVMGVSLTPPLLELGGSACSPEEIPCLGSDFAFESGSDAGTCFVPVRGTGPPVDDEDEDAIDERVDLAVEALVVCPVGEQETCDEFAAAAAADAQTIALDIRVAETTETSSSSSSSSSASEESEETTEESTPADDADTPPD